MNTIEQLNERITQLTELVKTGSEAIKAMKVALKTAEEERDRLADQRREQEPKFERVSFEEQYYYIRGINDGTFCIQGCIDIGCEHSVLEYENNNYFHTKERAQEVADKINLLLKLERMYDTFCPDFVPDWNNYNERKYVVNVVYKGKGYSDKGELVASHTIGTKNFAEVYFPTLEIAQKVCDILNAEERSKDV